MEEAGHFLQYTIVAPETPMNSGARLTQIGLATSIRAAHTLAKFLMMSDGPMSWKSRRPDNFSLSTSEAKFVATSQAGQEAHYLRETLKDFGYQ